MSLLRCRHAHHWVISLLAVLLLAGCEVAGIQPAGAELTPVAARSHAADEADTAVARVADVAVEVTSNAWPGEKAITQQLTPLYVRIENHSDAALLIQLRAFALIGPHEEYFAALPPLAASVDIGEFPDDRLASTVDDNWLFNHHGFFVSPFYSDRYPALPVWSPNAGHDNVFRVTPHRNASLEGSHSARRPAISAKELSARVLPEGVVEPGGSISGFLLFEHVDPGLTQVTFQGELIDATTGHTLGRLRIPFTREN